MWMTVSLRRVCWGCFPLACSPLSASAPWPVQGKRNNGLDMRNEVRKFCSVPDFVSELVLTIFPVFQGLDLKLWSHSRNLRIVGCKNQACYLGKDYQEQTRMESLEVIKGCTFTTSLFQCCTAYLVKCNVQSEFPKLKLVISSLHPL